MPSEMYPKSEALFVPRYKTNAKQIVKGTILMILALGFFTLQIIVIIYLISWGHGLDFSHLSDDKNITTSNDDNYDDDDDSGAEACIIIIVVVLVIILLPGILGLVCFCYGMSYLSFGSNMKMIIFKDGYSYVGVLQRALNKKIPVSPWDEVKYVSLKKPEDDSEQGTDKFTIVLNLIQGNVDQEVDKEQIIVMASLLDHLIPNKVRPEVKRFIDTKNPEYVKIIERIGPPKNAITN